MLYQILQFLFLLGDILAVDGGIDASTARQVKSGDGDSSPFYITTTKVGIGVSASPDALLHLRSATPWMDGHLDNYYNSSFQDKGGGGNAAPQPQSATGGIKTVMNDKTIHTFIATGSLVCNPNFDKDVEYVVIGGAGRRA